MGRGRLKASMAVFAAVAGLLSAQAPAAATGVPAAAAKDALLEGNPDLAKVSMHLLAARNLARTDATSEQIAAQLPVLRFVGGLPLIEIRYSKLTAATVARVEGIGFRPTGTFPELGVMVGVVDYELLDEIAAVPAVVVIRPEYGAQVATGSVTSQADASIRAATARTQFGVDGTGVTVGVLSDSFNDTLGGAVAGTGCNRAVTGMPNQISGDLPSSVKLLDNGLGGNSDEGAGMAELIADLAPGADLMFHTAFNSLADFAAGITELSGCGADVIVDDIIYFAEPMFQDGLIAQAAQDAVDAGVPYFASANNQGSFGVDSDYSDWNPGTDDTAFPPSGDDFHDFGGGDRFASVTIPNGAGARFVLQWNEPFSGTLGAGAVNDLDLYLCSAENPAACTVASSTNVQGCSVGDPAVPSGDPLEIIEYTNTTGSAQTAYLAVEHYCGSEDAHFRIGSFGINISVTGLTYEPSIYNEFQLFGHAAASGVGAVAAVDYREIDSGGATTGGPEINVESFSNLGGDLPFYFDRNGNPLAGAPVTRFKPDIAAPDGTNTTFFGGTDPEPDGFPNFYGTSAAAPHAAAIAALMLDLRPTLTPAVVLSALRTTAVDIEAAGSDPLSGAGLIDAVDALDAANTATPPVNDDVVDAVTVGIPSTTVSSNNYATTEVGETTLCPDPVNGDSTYGATVWYRVQPPSDASLVVDTRGSAFDTVLGVYSGTVGSLTQVGCNDDIDFGVDLDSEVSFPATAGSSYWIQVGGYGATSEEGQLTLNIAAVGGSFTDDDGNVHEGFIEAMAISGITLGCNPPANDMYCPRDAVSRAQMATFLVRALGLTPSEDNGSFTDHLASVHRRNINALRIAGITQGCNPPANTLYCPNDPVRRDQMATFLGRALSLTPMVPPVAYSFGDGVWSVGGDVQPGTYRNSDSSAACYWARLSGFGGGLGDIIANEFTYQRDVVTIQAGDTGFESDRCGMWTNRILPRTSSITAPFGGGAFFVGSEVAPGLWRNSDSAAGCYWERVSGFSGVLADIITNQFSSVIQTVTVDATDYGFFSEDCGTWTKIG
ncbi:MAG: S8 family serine peptidase [Acidimicrobiia bacterium]